MYISKISVLGLVSSFWFLTLEVVKPRARAARYSLEKLLLVLARYSNLLNTHNFMNIRSSFKLSSTIYARNYYSWQKNLTKRKVKMNLYLKFDARECFECFLYSKLVVGSQGIWRMRWNSSFLSPKKHQVKSFLANTIGIVFIVNW